MSRNRNKNGKFTKANNIIKSASEPEPRVVVEKQVVDTSGGRIIHHSGKLYIAEQDQLFTSYRQIEIPTGVPNFSWKGGKMDIEDWRRIVAFFRYYADVDDSEVQVRLFYLPDENRIIPWAFPQKKRTGMTTKEIENSDHNAQMSEILSRGATPCGSNHSHVRAGAFQSPTDIEDEKDHDGIHITLGKVTSDPIDIHARVYYRTIKYDANLSEWIDVLSPENMALIEQVKREAGVDVTDQIVKRRLLGGISKEEAASDGAFPQAWRDNVIEEPAAVVGFGGAGYYGRQREWSHGSGYGGSYGYVSAGYLNHENIGTIRALTDGAIVWDVMYESATPDSMLDLETVLWAADMFTLVPKTVVFPVWGKIKSDGEPFVYAIIKLLTEVGVGEVYRAIHKRSWKLSDYVQIAWVDSKRTSKFLKNEMESNKTLTEIDRQIIELLARHPKFEVMHMREVIEFLCTYAEKLGKGIVKESSDLLEMCISAADKNKDNYIECAIAAFAIMKRFTGKTFPAKASLFAMVETLDQNGYDVSSQDFEERAEKILSKFFLTSGMLDLDKIKAHNAGKSKTETKGDVVTSKHGYDYSVD